MHALPPRRSCMCGLVERARHKEKGSLPGTLSLRKCALRVPVRAWTNGTRLLCTTHIACNYAALHSTRFVNVFSHKSACFKRFFFKRAVGVRTIGKRTSGGGGLPRHFLVTPCAGRARCGKDRPAMRDKLIQLSYSGARTQKWTALAVFVAISSNEEAPAAVSAGRCATLIPLCVPVKPQAPRQRSR